MCAWPINRYGCVKTPKSQRIERLVRISSTGLQDRQRHVEEDAPRARAVDLRRLDELARHLRERA